MGNFLVRYDSRVVNYDRRGFIRLATGHILLQKSLRRGIGPIQECYYDYLNIHPDVGACVRKIFPYIDPKDLDDCTKVSIGFVLLPFSL